MKHRISRLGVVLLLGAFVEDPLSQPASAQQPGQIINGNLARTADSVLSRAAAAGFAGVVLIAKGDTILLRRGYGMADRDRKVRYLPNTIFSVGSITKQFTAAGILALEADGKLSVQDPLSRFFPEAPADKAGITLHQLLVHSAGIKDGFGGDYAVMSRDSLVGLALAAPLKFEPGTAWSYSNGGYSILAAILEKVAGVGYEQYIHDRLLSRAGMATTGYNLLHWDRARVAHGYRVDNADDGTPLDKLWGADGPYWNLKGNGGILSTVDDLYRWHRALRDRTVLPEAAMEKLERGYLFENPRDTTGTKSGYGWVHERRADGRRVMHHNGGNRVNYAMLRRYLDQGIVYIYATNSWGNTCADQPTMPCMRNLAIDRELRGVLFGETQ